MASVIIPANNEAALIARTLASLVPQLAANDEVIVVANGCSDNTEAIARSFEPRVTVVSVPEPSKTSALNLGDALARTFPRVYADADVEFGEGSLALLKQALQSGPWLAVAPEPRTLLHMSSWPVRAYYAVWQSMPYCRRGLIGGGVYALSEQGRRRFGAFPEVIADDGYVRRLFQEHERGMVGGARVTLKAPANLHWLLKIKTRSRMGNAQLEQLFPDLRANEEKAYGTGFLRLIRDPRRWPALGVYLYVAFYTRSQARSRARNRDFAWDKDLSNRGMTAECRR